MKLLLAFLCLLPLVLCASIPEGSAVDIKERFIFFSTEDWFTFPTFGTFPEVKKDLGMAQDVRK
ncbi:hypothetical protein DPMN_088422 [Dreissena polymorpha]|uniref:Uncharacterized protein n=1 Tax=Dreissena polymorpha TaxID=45954 RepID=A0A9D4KU25_DREPO|nr:hypothetical protein DPMN_088422 [Dreissena polymorpha]